MADGYGTLAKPVALDPFQNIVEVHWKTKPKNIIAVAFAVRMQIFVRLNGDGDAEISLRYWNPSSYEFSLPPLFWGQWVLDDEGWGGAASEINVTGLPPLGSPPDYDWTAGALAPPVAGCRWIDPTGGSLGIQVPVIGDHGDTEPRIFQSGVASIEDYDVDVAAIGSRTVFPVDTVAATLEGFDFQYAGAVAVPRVMSGADNVLIGGPGGVDQSVNFELWMLCTRVTS